MLLQLFRLVHQHISSISITCCWDCGAWERVDPAVNSLSWHPKSSVLPERSWGASIIHLNIPFYPPPPKKKGLTAIYLLISVHLFCHSVGKLQSSSFFQGLYLTNYKCKGLACTVALCHRHIWNSTSKAWNKPGPHHCRRLLGLSKLDFPLCEAVTTEPTTFLSFIYIYIYIKKRFPGGLSPSPSQYWDKAN